MCAVGRIPRSTERILYYVFWLLVQYEILGITWFYLTLRPKFWPWLDLSRPNVWPLPQPLVEANILALSEAEAMPRQRTFHEDSTNILASVEAEAKIIEAEAKETFTRPRPRPRYFNLGHVYIVCGRSSRTKHGPQWHHEEVRESQVKH